MVLGGFRSFHVLVTTRIVTLLKVVITYSSDDLIWKEHFLSDKDV